MKVPSFASVRARRLGRFYHDSRFATLLELVNHYNSFKKLNLADQQKYDLVEYLRSP
jgi:hypothetical protein